MSYHRFRLVPAAPLLLALLVGACGWAKAPTNETGASGSTATTAAFGGMLLPGLYDVVQTGDVEDRDTECITAAQLAKQLIAPEDSLQKGWRVVGNSMSGGRYSLEAAGPENARITSIGTYTATTYDGDFVMTYDQAGKPQTIRLKVKAKRIADNCKDKDKRGDGTVDGV